ncbi:Polyketide synthase, enoylreductase domain [Fusarium oxysporum f. sp. vasinfectum]|nr:Polyketide synthase, enoylreductase domain [Fusarium oxysporum f. sp. vasinfectum]
MRAARYYGIKDIRVEQVPEPLVQPGQVKVAPKFVGICGTGKESNLHEYLGGPNFCPTKPHPLTSESIPVTLGHEFSGIISEVGPDVTGFEVGQPCAVQPTLFCGHCAACHTSAENVCHTGGFLGLSGGGGGLSESVCVNATHVFALPKDLPLEIGALVEPLSVAWHAMSAAPEINEKSKAKGVSEIIVSEVAASRQEFARQFGATKVVNPIKEDLNEVVLGLTGGLGADVVFDCAGVPASVKGACEVVRTRGTVVNIAIWEKEIPFNPNWLTFKESAYKSVLGYQREDFQAVIDNLASGAIKPSQMITRKIKMENIVEDGINALITDKDNQVKILVDINDK